jgi:hypothetical protein
MPLTLTSDMSIATPDPASPARYPVPFVNPVDYPTACRATYAETVAVNFTLVTCTAEECGITTLRLDSDGIGMGSASGIGSGKMIGDGFCDSEPDQHYELQR